jgi:hypothetical protein
MFWLQDWSEWYDLSVPNEVRLERHENVLPSSCPIS